MIRQRSVLESVVLHYVGQPSTATISMDGVTTSTVTNLPNHSKYKTRRVSVPQGTVGFIPQFSTDSTTRLDHEFVAIPVSSYATQLIWHYYEVTISGSVTLSLYVDEVQKVISKQITMPFIEGSTTLRKDIHTLKVYYPPLSFGYIPHLINDTSDEGDIIQSKPVALPPAYYSGTMSHSECQITYKGDVTVQFYLDGNNLGDSYTFKAKTNTAGENKYVTEKFYLPSGAVGHVFQYEQIGEYGLDNQKGDIAMLNTDATLSATDLQPQVPVIQQ